MVEKSLEELKQEYKNFQKKYNLPSFEQLNEDFNIEKAVEEETDFLLRGVRKFISDKISDYMRFAESLLNPVNVPMFVFSILKTLNSEDKKLLEDIYKRLSKMEIRIMEVDIEYSEEKEVNFIKETFKEWQDIKKDWLKVLDRVKKNWDNKLERNNERYFG